VADEQAEFGNIAWPSDDTDAETEAELALRAAGKKQIPYQKGGCYERGKTQEDRDAACEGDYVCARDGFNGRNFGCTSGHCCAYNEEKPDGTNTCDSWCGDEEHALLAWKGKKCDWSRCSTCDDCFHPRPQQNEIFMRLMSKQNMVVCGCGKCGSTSMYNHIYENVFSKAWNYTGQPYAQNVLSDRWEGVFNSIDDEPQQKEVMSKAFSFALIRDPKERLLSAWKSKITCDNSGSVDKTDRSRMVKVLETMLPETQRRNLTCMSLETFLESLNTVHDAGWAQYLDKHFLPQDLGCFFRFPPSRWSAVVSIEEPKAFAKLNRHLGTAEPPSVTHASSIMSNVTMRSSLLLNKLTQNEYTMLRQYLPGSHSKKSKSASLIELPSHGPVHHTRKKPHAIGSHSKHEHHKYRRMHRARET